MSRDYSEIIAEVLIRSDTIMIKDCNFINEYNKIEAEVHTTAVDKGWWGSERSDAECIALIHSELSEALEYLRKDPAQLDDKIPEFKGVEAELADVIIRIMDLSNKRDWKVAEAILAKLEYNKTRPVKHGKRF